MTTYKVDGIGCEGCATAIRNAIGKAAPGAKVQVDVKTGGVRSKDLSTTRRPGRRSPAPATASPTRFRRRRAERCRTAAVRRTAVCNATAACLVCPAVHIRFFEPEAEDDVMRGLVSALVLVAATTAASLPAAAQQQSGQQQMQERMQQMQERMGQGGMQGQMPMGRGMMGPGMMGQGMMRGMGPGHFVEGRLAFLETELGIREDQQDAWQDFAEAMRANAGSMQRMHERMWSDGGRPETLPERLKLHEEMMSAHLAAMREMRQALMPLYEALDDEQKETLDALMGMGMM